MPLRRNSSTSSQTALTGNILLVDDNRLGLSARKCVLEELGHRIVTALNAADALEHFTNAKFDLVVTDYKMPRMDGLELIVRLREMTPEIPVILISGFVDTLGLNEQNTGADVVIQKSANEVSHMVRSVARLLRKKPVAKKAIVPKPVAAEVPAAARKKKSS
jgi:two-component system response regulator CpxR